MICPICRYETDRLVSQAVNGTFLSDRCTDCMKMYTYQQPISSTNQDYRIRRQQEDHRADILQPYKDGKPNMDFVRVYKDRIDDYFTREELKKAEREQ